MQGGEKHQASARLRNSVSWAVDALPRYGISILFKLIDEMFKHLSVVEGLKSRYVLHRYDIRLNFDGKLGEILQELPPRVFLRG